MKPLLNRPRLIRRLRARLVRDGYPRLQMSLIVLLTGGVGFLTSSILLQTGVDTLWLRYLVAFAVAYPAFLLLLWLWLRTRAEDYADLPDFANLTSSGGGDPGIGFEPALELARLPVEGGGGGFGGGGASAGFDTPAVTELPLASDAMALDAGDAKGLTDAAGEALGAVGDADEFWIVVLVAVILLAVLAASGWMIYIAPDLFAELTVDGALTGGLYHRLRKAAPGHWLETALRRTWLPFALTAAIVVGAGWALQQEAPEARSLSTAIEQLK